MPSGSKDFIQKGIIWISGQSLGSLEFIFCQQEEGKADD